MARCGAALLLVVLFFFKGRKSFGEKWLVSILQCFCLGGCDSGCGSFSNLFEGFFLNFADYDIQNDVSLILLFILDIPRS